MDKTKERIGDPPRRKKKPKVYRDGTGERAYAHANSDGSISFRTEEPSIEDGMTMQDLMRKVVCDNPPLRGTSLRIYTTSIIRPGSEPAHYR